MSFARYVADLDITPGRAYAPFWSAFIQVLRDTMEQQSRPTTGQPTIRVSTSVTSERFALMVEDDGPGADWDPVRDACEALGGAVELESRKGAGIRISFVFPAHGADRRPIPPAVPRSAAPRAPAA